MKYMVYAQYFIPFIVKFITITNTFSVTRICREVPSVFVCKLEVQKVPCLDV